MIRLDPVFAWTFTTLANNIKNLMTNIVPILLSAIGGVGIIGAAYIIVTGLISHGKKQVSWPATIILLIFSLALFTTGIGILTGAMNPEGAVGELFN